MAKFAYCSVMHIAACLVLTIQAATVWAGPADRASRLLREEPVPIALQLALPGNGLAEIRHPVSPVLTRGMGEAVATGTGAPVLKTDRNELAMELTARQYEQVQRMAAVSSNTCLSRRSKLGEVERNGGGIMWSSQDGFNVYVANRELRALNLLTNRRELAIGCQAGSTSAACMNQPKDGCD